MQKLMILEASHFEKMKSRLEGLKPGDCAIHRQPALFAYKYGHNEAQLVCGICAKQIASTQNLIPTGEFFREKVVQLSELHHNSAVYFNALSDKSTEHLDKDLHGQLDSAIKQLHELATVHFNGKYA